MGRIILLALAFCFFSVVLMGQGINGDRQFTYESYTKKYNVVDTALMEVVYAHSMVDPVKKKKELIYEILAMGNNYSRYFDYAKYKEDSVENSRAGEKYWFNDWYNGPMKDYTMIYGYTRERVQKNYKGSSLHFEGYILGYYYYEEPLHQMEWTLGYETKEVLGYECRKATCRWRGRDWTAWYSELPYSDGPWMFGGLPGLIMELTDATGEHKIQAKGIKRDVYPFGLPRLTRFRSKRERYRSNLEDYIENALTRVMESGTVISGMEKRAKKPRRLFYCPLELE